MTRTLVALALVYVGLFGMPKLPSVVVPSSPSVKEPSVEMQSVVSDVAKICRTMDAFDRLVWMHCWEDSASAVEGTNENVELTIDNTLGLRLFTGAVFDAAWRRMAKANGKYKGLEAAVEKAFTAAVGNDVKPWSPELAGTVAEFYEALAWAGAAGD